MPSYDDKSQGAIFPERNRKSEKSPTSTGFLTLTKADLQALVAKAKAGEEIKLRVSAWSREGNSGKFLSILAEPEGAWKNQQQGQQFAGNNTGGGRPAPSPDRTAPRPTRQPAPPQNDFDPFDDEIPF